jgi:hypothetical protein
VQRKIESASQEQDLRRNHKRKEQCVAEQLMEEMDNCNTGNKQAKNKM